MTDPHAPDTPPVRRRHVFFIPGHHPAAARRYREIYRREGARQAEISGYALALKPRDAPKGRYQWQVEATIEGTTTSTVMEVLQWNDLVRESLNQPLTTLYGRFLKTLWFGIRVGVPQAYARVRPVMLIATLYPFVMLLLLPLAGGLAGYLLARLGGLLVPLPWPVTAALTIAGAVGLLHWFKRRDDQFFIAYLLLSYAYFFNAEGHTPKALADRERLYADHVAEALAQGNDEVLIVGHSAGVHIGVQIAAQLLREGRVPVGRLALLGLGSVIPMVSLLPHAQQLRADLNLLARTPDLAWIDVSAPADGMCFALADPVAVTGVAPDPQYWPKVISAAFSKTLSEEARNARDFTFFRTHFQYIYAFDKVGAYDYFRITAGPMRLLDRFRSRRSSPQTNRRVASRYTDFPDQA